MGTARGPSCHLCTVQRWSLVGAELEPERPGLACRSPCRGSGEARRRQILMLNDPIASLTTISQEIARLGCY